MDEEQRKRVFAAIAAMNSGTRAERVIENLEQEDWLVVLQVMEEEAAVLAKEMERRGMDVPDREPFRMPKPS